MELFKLVFATELSLEQLATLPSLAMQLETQVLKLNPKQRITYLFHITHHIAEAIENLGTSLKSLCPLQKRVYTHHCPALGIGRDDE